MKKSVYILLCSVVIFCVLFGCSQKGAEKNIQAEISGSDTLKEEVLYASTPDETGARASQIPNFSSERTLCAFSMPHNAGKSLQLISVGRYSGAYVEDGTDDSVSDVAAVVIQNTGDKFIKSANITLVGKNNKEYSFSLTSLPAGCSVLLLETNRAVFIAEESITVATVGTVEEQPIPQLCEDKVSVDFADGKLILKNLTDKDFRAVYIRYKNYTAGNVYMGGVTYSASFSNVTTSGEYVCESAHFTEGFSQIMMVQIVE